MPTIIQQLPQLRPKVIDIKVDTENNLIAVKGAVPGTKGTIVTLANSVKA